MTAQPQELRRRETREGAIAGELDQARETDRRLDLRALGAGALVVPEDRRAQHAVATVERHEAVHLARETDRRRGARILVQLRQNRLGRRPPVRGILLCPPGSRRRERVADLGAREHAPVGVDRQSLDG